MIDTDFLNHLTRLSLIIEKKVNSNYIGERESIHTGAHGLIFHDHKIYANGDDFRKIDWRVFARTDKFYVKRFEEERNLIVHVVLDSSASMDFGKTTKKFDYASMIGIGFAFMALRKNEKFVLSTFSEKLQVFQPRKGKRQLINMIDHLNNMSAQGVSKFEESLKNYSKLINSRALVVIISDFLYDPEEIRRSLIGFKNNQIKLVQVLDDLEVNLNLQGEFKFKDKETKSMMQTFINPFLRKNYLSKLEDHNKKVKRIAAGFGASFHTVTTDTDIFDTFYQILR